MVVYPPPSAPSAGLARNPAAAAATAAPTTGGPPGVRVRRATLADLPLLAPWLHAAFPSEEPEVRPGPPGLASSLP